MSSKIENRRRQLARWLLISFLTAPLLIFGLLWMIYRIPTGESITTTAVVQYKYLQLDDFLRPKIESLLGNRAQYFVAGPIRKIYVKATDHAIIWQDDPLLRKEPFTFEVSFTTRRLLFADGYTPASNATVLKVAGDPAIKK